MLLLIRDLVEQLVRGLTKSLGCILPKRVAWNEGYRTVRLLTVDAGVRKFTVKWRFIPATTRDYAGRSAGTDLYMMPML
jgi:hypothetical protein